MCTKNDAFSFGDNHQAFMQKGFCYLVISMDLALDFSLLIILTSTDNQHDFLQCCHYLTTNYVTMHTWRYAIGPHKHCRGPRCRISVQVTTKKLYAQKKKKKKEERIYSLPEISHLLQKSRERKLALSSVNCEPLFGCVSLTIRIGC